MMQVLKAARFYILHHPVLTKRRWGELLACVQFSEVYMHTAANAL